MVRGRWGSREGEEEEEEGVLELGDGGEVLVEKEGGARWGWAA